MMDKQAFPSTEREYRFRDESHDERQDIIKAHNGMTLREYYAGQALVGLLSQSPSGAFSEYKSTFEVLLKEENKESGKGFKRLSELCCGIAEALIAELNKTKES